MSVWIPIGANMNINIIYVTFLYETFRNHIKYINSLIITTGELNNLKKNHVDFKIKTIIF